MTASTELTLVHFLTAGTHCTGRQPSWILCKPVPGLGNQIHHWPEWFKSEVSFQQFRRSQEWWTD